MSNQPMSMFVPIQKIDEDKRLIYGTMTAAVVDRSNEILDYHGSKPHFEKWSGDVAKASGGKSKGNLRAMHKQVSAGKLVDITFDDANQKIDYCAKVVDDNEWNKVLEGVYTGVSIGGKYASRTLDPVTKAHKFVAVPGELSLVDIPCLPVATFDVIKADGTVMQKNFQPWQPANEDLAKKAGELAKAAGTGSWPDYIESARAALIDERLQSATVIEEEGGEPVTKAASATNTGAPVIEQEPAPAEPTPAELGLVQKWETPDGQQFMSKADAARHVMTLDRINPVAAALARANAAMEKGADGLPKPATPGVGAYGDVEYADPGLLKDATPRFPIDTPFNVRASWGHFCKDAADMGYSDDALVKIGEAIGIAWADVIGNAPPHFEQMQLVADIGLFSDALEVLGKRGYLNPAGMASNYMGGIMTCGPSASNGLGIVQQLASITSDSVRAANALAELKGNDDDPTVQHARDVVAANATLLAEATHVEVSAILDEVDQFSGTLPDSMEGMDDAAKLADDIIDLVKGDPDAMEAREEAAEAREVLYVQKWLDIIGQTPPPIDENPDAEVEDITVMAGGLLKMAGAMEPQFLTSGLQHIAAVAAQVANFTMLVNDIEADCIQRGETTESSVLARDILKSLGDFLVVCAHEEVGDLHDEIDMTSVEHEYGIDDDDDVMHDEYCKAAQGMIDLAKSDPVVLEKRGARTSKADMKMVQSIHDYANKLGAACGMDKVDPTGDLAKGGDALAKIEADNAELRKQVADAVSGIDNLTKQAVTLQEANAKLQAEVTELRNTPTQTVPARADTAGGTLSKGQESGGATGELHPEDVAKAFAALSPDEQRMVALRSAFNNPVPMQNRGLK